MEWMHSAHPIQASAPTLMPTSTLALTTRSKAIVSMPSDTATIASLVSSTTPTRTSAATSAMHDIEPIVTTTSTARTHIPIRSWPLTSEGNPGFVGHYLIVAYNFDSPSKNRTSCHEGGQHRTQALLQSPHVIASTVTSSFDARISSQFMANEGDSALSSANNPPSHSSNRSSACEGDNAFSPKSKHRPVYEGEATEDDSHLAYKPNKLGPLCPGITRRAWPHGVQVPPDSAWPLVSRFHPGRRLFLKAFHRKPQ